jgi:mono/diheme cytochrome c family protein
LSHRPFLTYLNEGNRSITYTAAGNSQRFYRPWLAVNDEAAVQANLGRQLLLAYIVMATSTCVWAQDIEKGRIEFLSNCAGCHGADGKGAGRMSDKLKIKPADLTVLAKKNNGVFSPDAVAERVDGRSAPHRDSEMPIWGCRQGPPPGQQRKAHEPKPIDSLLDMPCDPEDVIQKRIRDIVGYLSQIQER